MRRKRSLCSTAPRPLARASRRSSPRTITRVELDYRRSAVFDDVIEITTWMEWVRGASLRMACHVRRGDEILAVAATEHAMVDLEGRPRRIPASGGSSSPSARWRSLRYTRSRVKRAGA